VASDAPPELLAVKVLAQYYETKQNAQPVEPVLAELARLLQEQGTPNNEIVTSSLSLSLSL
jgi:hypothetical protein